jgi:hypothetical protein
VLVHEPLAAAPELAVDGAVGGTERPGRAARRDLSVDAHRDPARDLDGEVHEVVRDLVVVARRRMHRQPLGADRVAPLAGARERHFHSVRLAAGPNRVRTRGVLPARLLQGEA